MSRKYKLNIRVTEYLIKLVTWHDQIKKNVCRQRRNIFFLFFFFFFYISSSKRFFIFSKIKLISVPRLEFIYISVSVFFLSQFIVAHRFLKIPTQIYTLKDIDKFGNKEIWFLFLHVVDLKKKERTQNNNKIKKFSLLFYSFKHSASS